MKGANDPPFHSFPMLHKTHQFFPLYKTNTLLSSANIKGFPVVRHLGKLFTYIKNNNGLKIEPCGTPQFKHQDFEIFPLNSTFCEQLLK